MYTFDTWGMKSMQGTQARPPPSELVQPTLLVTTLHLEHSISLPCNYSLVLQSLL